MWIYFSNPHGSPTPNSWPHKTTHLANKKSSIAEVLMVNESFLRSTRPLVIPMPFIFWLFFLPFDSTLLSRILIFLFLKEKKRKQHFHYKEKSQHFLFLFHPEPSRILVFVLNVLYGSEDENWEAHVNVFESRVLL